MDKVTWIEVVPSLMSAIATFAAAFAAFLSLKISKDSRDIAKKSALAVQHNSAAIELTKAIEELKSSTTSFLYFADELVTEWAHEIERLDHRSKGGKDPRPLRHVITNAADMLVEHTVSSRKAGKYSRWLMYSLVRNGVPGINDSEYESLLKIGDCTYLDFESTFGKPSIRKQITKANAFRWAFYQLAKRVTPEDWKNIWNEAWSHKGWLRKYESEYATIKPTLENINKSLKIEKAKLAHNVFPIEANDSLSSKYDNIIMIIESLLEECNLEMLHSYIDCSFEPDYIELIIYAFSVTSLVTTYLDRLSDNSDFSL